MGSRQIFLPLAAAAMCLVSTTAGALTFTIDSAQWALGLGWAAACTSRERCDDAHTVVNIDWAINPLLSRKSISLADSGDSLSVGFGSGKLSEEDNGFSLPPPPSSGDETDGLDIAAMLSLSGIGDVKITGATQIERGPLTDSGTDLAVAFTAATVDLTGGQLTVDLSPVAWTCNAEYQEDCVSSHSVTKTVTATFRWTPLDPLLDPPAGAAPEPATIALMGLGICGIAYQRRRRSDS